MAAAKERGLPLPAPTGFEAVAGHGIRAEVDGRDPLGNRHDASAARPWHAGRARAVGGSPARARRRCIVAVDGRAGRASIAVADTLEAELGGGRRRAAARSASRS